MTADPDPVSSIGKRVVAAWPLLILLLSCFASLFSRYALGLPWALVALLCMTAAAVVARWTTFSTRAIEQALCSTAAPFVAGVATSLVVWTVWGSLHPLPVIHDEASYLFQAKIFAAGRVSFPSPPLPEFFEQYHVLVTPRYLSKYDPGHALLLSIGVFAGIPALIPLLLSGIAGGLVFALARRVAGPWVGLLTWGFWVTAGANLRHRPTYLSEVTTSALLLGVWWALIEWNATRRGYWLLVVSVCLAWGAITRPVTMLAAAVPVAILVLPRIVRMRAWRQLVVAAGAGLVVLAIQPLWNAETTGSWRRSPRMIYTEEYLPYDAPGFGPDSSRALRQGPPDFAAYDAFYRSDRAHHTLARLPAIAAERLGMIGFEMWGGWRAALAPFALAGLFLLTGAGWLAVATAVLVVAAYVTYYGPPFQLAYYLELQPVLALVTMLGVWAMAGRLLGDGARRFAVVVAVLALWPARLDVARARRVLARDSLPVRHFREALATLPPGKAIVFLRYPTNPPIVQSVMGNEPDLARARVWVVYDRGSDNGRLERLAPDRSLFLYDISTRTLARFNRAAP